MEKKTAIKLPSGPIKYSRSHAQYWLAKEGRLFQQHGKPEFCCRFSHNGKRGFFDLNTTVRTDAAKQAVLRYRYVVAHGWEKAAKNPEFRTQPPEPKTQILTVGGWIEQVRTIALVSHLTLNSYEQALRRIVAESVLGVEHRQNQHEKWRAKVDAVPLAQLTGNVVAKWVKERTQAAGGDPTVEERATHTVNHVLRSAKSLFSAKKILSKMPRETVSLLGEKPPLSDVSLLEEDSSARFTPSVDPESLLLMAKNDLGAPRGREESDASFALREQQWIAFLLSFCGGLRRKESDLLTWWQVHLDNPRGPQIELKITKYFRPKNKAHGKAIPLEIEVAQILQAYRQQHLTDEFVLHSDREVDLQRIGKPRCHETWQALNKWLKSHGISDSKPVHALRKSVGALMASRHGIHAAQRLLRHTTPMITSKYYSDSEARETPGIGGILSGKPKGRGSTPKRPK